ncbi:hypothetical protein D1007_08343 [Hordeum vulgare]|nr:hypothetical protein D1007_08343 [Hordeum vulgare]
MVPVAGGSQAVLFFRTLFLQRAAGKQEGLFLDPDGSGARAAACSRQQGAAAREAAGQPMSMGAADPVGPRRIQAGRRRRDEGAGGVAVPCRLGLQLAAHSGDLPATRAGRRPEGTSGEPELLRLRMQLGAWLARGSLRGGGREACCKNS